MKPGPKPRGPSHGEVRRYHDGCRCDLCVASKEEQRAYDRARYLANADKVKERERARRAANKAAGIKPKVSPAKREKVRQRASAWYHANKQRHMAVTRLRKARIRGAPGRATSVQILARIDFFGGMCSYCRERPFKHLDHAVPVSRGGSNWASNIRPACSECNLRKYTKTWREFLAA